jgi:hypothetical protein
MHMLTESECLASWEPERENIENYIRTAGFTDKAIPKAADNFIKSMAFAGIPCTTQEGIRAAFIQYQRRRD